ncbi:MAG TPA: sialidase family protein [Mycobacteriales bacterium]|nr:sialidase family protein [Mycobacteriales bacterium]
MRLIVAGVTLAAGATTLPAAAASRHTVHSAASARSATDGFYVTRYGRVSRVLDGGQVQDRRGGEHVVTLSADLKHFVYLTKWRGQRHWTRHRIPGVPKEEPYAVNWSPTLSTDGKRVIFYANTYRYTSASITARRLPRPKYIVTNKECRGVIWLLPHDRITTYVDNGLGRRVCTGVLGGALTPTATPPDPGNATEPITERAAMRDASTGRLYMIGDQAGFNQQGSFDADSWWSWTSDDDGRTWDGPTAIPGMPQPTFSTTGRLKSRVQLASAAAGDGQVWVVFSAYDNRRGHRHDFDPPQLLHMSKQGTWQPLVPLAHTTGHDDNVQLAVNRATGALHAVYVHNPVVAGTDGGVLMHEYLSHGTWSTPRRLAAHVDRFLSMSIGRRGHPVASYFVTS